METVAWACPFVTGSSSELNNEEVDWIFYLNGFTAGQRPILHRCFADIVSVEERDTAPCWNLDGKALSVVPFVRAWCAKGHVLQGPKDDVLYIPVTAELAKNGAAAERSRN